MNAYRSLVGKTEGKRSLGRPRCRWVDNIRMDLGEIGWGGMNWIGLAQYRDQWRAVVHVVMNLWNAGKFLISSMELDFHIIMMSKECFLVCYFIV
jgi:hypothetical protein